MLPLNRALVLSWPWMTSPRCGRWSADISRRGFTVLEATNGVHALEVLDTEAWTVDAMLTDLVMPKMSGPELIRRVRARDPHLPILCMSGNGLSPADAATAATLAAPAIQKPMALPRLSAQLVEVIGNRRPS